jgi:dTDP-4-amino-4,6-dideoxygalactose transaminase
VKLGHIESWNESRRRHAATYDRLLAEAGLLSKDVHAPVRALTRHGKARHVFHLYVIRVERRDDLRAFLGTRKIGTEIYYPLPLHLQPAFLGLGMKAGDLPVAEQAAKEVLALPMFPELTESEIRWVVESMAEFYS